MSALPASSSVVSLLRQHGLLDLPQQERLAALARGHPTPAGLLAELQRLAWLTPYQAQLITAGRAAQLVVGPFVLLDLLGQGAMARVYRARHTRLGRLVALKVLRPEALAGARARARFEREMRAMARLQHPGIAAAHDAGQAGSDLYLAMELIDGIDLSRLVKQNGPLPVPLACDLVRQAAEALDYAHSLGVIHRDVKPSNLMVIRSPKHAPVVKLVDFGLTRFDDGTGPLHPLTLPGGLLGTIDYMAPEQALAAHAADARSDVYGLGASLFYLLTAQPPIPGRDVVEKMQAITKGEVRSVAALRQPLPEGLEAVLVTLLAHDPKQRPASAREVAAALGPFCQVAPRDGRGGAAPWWAPWGWVARLWS